MPRYYRPRRRFTRRRKAYIWVRGAESTVTPVNQPSFIAHDLLERYRSTAGINLNLPEFTIWRVHIKIAIKFSVTAAAVTDGALFAMFVEQSAAQGGLTAVFDPLLNPYNQRYMMWDALMANELRMQGGTDPTNIYLYRNYDIKTHRRLVNLGDSLWLTVTPFGGATGLTFDSKYSILLLQR